MLSTWVLYFLQMFIYFLLLFDNMWGTSMPLPVGIILLG